MKRFLKLFPLTLLFCLALTLGLVACGGKSYSVTAEYDAVAGSVVLSEAGKGSDGKYKEGSSVTVTVAPNAGYAVSAFTVNGAAQTLSENAYTFTVKEDTKISVTFEKTAFSVTLEKDFEEKMGTAALSSPASGTTYAKDELVTLTVTVNAGYLVEKVTVGGEEIELNEDGKYSFKVKADTTIKVTLRAIGRYKVTVGAFDETMGTVDVSPEADADGAYVEGTELTLSVSAKYAYKLLSVKVDGSDVTLDEDGQYTFKIQKNTSVDASFAARKPYEVTFYFDTETCSLSYIGENEEGRIGDISLQPNVKTELYEGETVFTVTPAGGYELAWVEVNGKEVPLSERSFTLDIGEALQDDKGEINVGVLCGFVFTKRDSLAGEYELTDDVWYSFTLEAPAVFEFSATNYVAYAAFYTMTQTGDTEWDLDNETPVWLFNDDGRSKYAIHTFEAGTYMVRFSSSTGDGAASSKLTVTEIMTLNLEMPEEYIGVWKSTDGLYSLTIGRAEALGKDYLVLKKEEKTLSTKVTYDEAYDKEYGYFVAFGQNKHWLAPLGGSVPGTLAFGEKDEDGDYTTITLFLPDPLPSYTAPEELYGIYSGADLEDNPVDDLVISGGNITWGSKAMNILTKIDLSKAESVAVASYQESENTTRYYGFTFMRFGSEYVIMLVDLFDPDSSAMFELDEKLSEGALDQEYWGRWDCGVYTLNITANSVSLTKNGEPIDVTVGTFTRTLGDKEHQTVHEYVSFAFDGKSFYVNTLAHGRMNLYPTNGSLNVSERMIFVAKYTITVNAPHATVNIIDKKELYELDASVFFNVTPEAGYVVTSVKVNGVDWYLKEEEVNYVFFISEVNVITVECAPISSAEVQTSPVTFDDELLGTWQNSELKVTIEKHGVALSDGAGNAIPHSLRAETYRGRQYNAVVLGETCYLFLKANGT